MAAQPTTAPVLSGPVPPLAVGFTSRLETGFQLADGLRPGETILLVPPQAGDPDDGPSAAGRAAEAAGGTGKTQLAVGFAHQMWSTRAVDLLVWVAAGNRTAIVAGYARAAADLNLAESGGAGARAGAGAGEIADVGAQRFLDWLRRTQRRWAVVLDGVTSPADLDGLWPRGRRARSWSPPGCARRSWPIPAPGGPPTASPVSAAARRSAT